MQHYKYEPLIEIAESEEYKLYSRRWLILTLYVLIYISNSIQMQQYISITETLVVYYDISISEVNWSELVYFLEFVIFALPSISVIEKLGLRRTVLISAIGTALAAWIKVAGVTRNRYWVIIVGQAVNGIFCNILTVISPKIASKWFGAQEISLASSIGITASSVSYAIGYLIPAMMVDPKNVDTIERSLFIINIIYAAIPTLLTPLLFLYFYDNPPTPPTKTQCLIKKHRTLSHNHRQTIKQFITNPSFLCTAFIYIINSAYCGALTTILNPIMIKHYPNSTTEIGYVGCIINISDILGLILIWLLLDKLKLFKFAAWLLVLLSLATTALFVWFVNEGIYLACFLSGLYGCFSNAALLMMVEIGIEVIYPESEIAVFAVFEMGAQTGAIIFTYLYTYFLLNNFNDVTINVTFIVILTLADAFLIFIKYDLKRQAVLN